jgi:hypothetical protein
MQSSESLPGFWPAVNQQFEQNFVFAPSVRKNGVWGYSVPEEFAELEGVNVDQTHVSYEAGAQLVDSVCQRARELEANGSRCGSRLRRKMSI